jgi:hypothetical protein
VGRPRRFCIIAPIAFVGGMGGGAVRHGARLCSRLC